MGICFTVEDESKDILLESIVLDACGVFLAVVSESEALSQASSSAHSTDAYEENRDGGLRPMWGRAGGGLAIPIITRVSLFQNS